MPSHLHESQLLLFRNQPSLAAELMRGVLDVQLPDATGFDICEFLCGEHPLPEIVLVSSRDASDYNGLIQTSHARGFISKADLSGETLRALLA